MALLKVKNGSRRPATLEIGETTARKDSASSTTRMATSMKVCGQSTNAMAREHTGEMRRDLSCEENTLATGMRTRNTVVALSSIRMEIDTMDTGLMECLKEKVE